MIKPIFVRILSFLCGVVVSVILMTPFLPDWEPVPYTNVVTYSEEWTDEGLLIRSSFVKNGACFLLSFATLSFADGTPRYVPFSDLDGLEEDFDREEGAQGLNIRVHVDKTQVDYVELRTRHSCAVDEEGTQKVVTEVFSRHESN